MCPWCLNELGFGSGPFEWRLGSGPVTLYTANFFRWTPLPCWVMNIFRQILWWHKNRSGLNLGLVWTSDLIVLDSMTVKTATTKTRLHEVVLKQEGEKSTKEDEVCKCLPFAIRNRNRRRPGEAFLLPWQIHSYFSLHHTHSGGNIQGGGRKFLRHLDAILDHKYQPNLPDRYSRSCTEDSPIYRL